MVSDPGGNGSPNDRWDAQALRDGISVAATFAIPPTLIGRFAFDDGASSGWAGILVLVTFCGFWLGGGVAAWRQQCGTPLSHSLVASLSVFIGAQAVFSIVRVLQGEVIRWGRISVSLALTLAAGLLGGVLGGFLQRRGVTPYR